MSNIDRTLQRSYDLKRRYGITVEEYDTLLALQDGGCAICGRRPKTRRLAVDHDHRLSKTLTKRASVRGLLCMQCNRGLQFFHDDPARFTKAAAYLRRPPARKVLV